MELSRRDAVCLPTPPVPGEIIIESHYAWSDRQQNSGGDAANNTCAHHSG